MVGVAAKTSKLLEQDKLLCLRKEIPFRPGCLPDLEPVEVHPACEARAVECNFVDAGDFESIRQRLHFSSEHVIHF